MSSVRKNHPASFKANVVLEALREDTPISNLASKYGVHAKDSSLEKRSNGIH